MTAELPSSRKAEQALLGILLYDNAAVERVPDYFKADHFYDPVHGRLFKAMYEAICRGSAVEPIMLKERFASDEAFEQLGGLRYLADLVDHAPAPSNTADFCVLIHDLAVRREILRKSAEWADAAQRERDTPALDIVERAEKDLYTIATLKEDQGPTAFGDILDAAIEMAAAAYARDGEIAGVSTGLGDLDKLLGGLRNDDLVIIAARPSMGKTALATNIAFKTAKTIRDESGVRRQLQAAIFSLEMSKEQLAMRILAEESGLAQNRISRGEIDVSEFSRLRDAAMEIRTAGLHIDDQGAIPLAVMAARCRRLKRTVGLDLIVVDYLQIMGGDEPNSQQRIANNVGGLKALAKELGIPVVALSQVSRKVDEREDKRPTLADLRESGAIEQDADVVMFVYREAYYLGRAQPKEGSAEHLKWEEAMDACRSEAEIIIAKQRQGPIGTVKVAFHGETTKFSDLTKDPQFSRAA